MFAGELDGDVVCNHIGFRADGVRQSISEMFRERDGAKLDNRPQAMWARARKAGWRVVRVIVTREQQNIDGTRRDYDPTRLMANNFHGIDRF
jgi:hypothetical protein